MVATLSPNIYCQVIHHKQFTLGNRGTCQHVSIVIDLWGYGGFVQNVHRAGAVHRPCCACAQRIKHPYLSNKRRRFFFRGDDSFFLEATIIFRGDDFGGGIARALS